MKSYIKSLQLIVILIITSIVFGNCTEDDYLKDGGIASPYYEGTVWEYLNSEKEWFEDLVEIIKLAGMEDVFRQKNITFFAPTSFSIRKSFNALNQYWYASGHDSIRYYSQIESSVWKEMLSWYILEDKYTLNDIPQLDTTAVAAYPGQVFLTYNDTPGEIGQKMNAGVVYGDANGVKYAGYRQILYSYVEDFTALEMKNAYVATCNIQPTNGVVHVIRFMDHDFGFYKYEFVMKAVAAGIKKNPSSDVNP